MHALPIKQAKEDNDCILSLPAVADAGKRVYTLSAEALPGVGLSIVFLFRALLILHRCDRAGKVQLGFTPPGE